MMATSLNFEFQFGGSVTNSISEHDVRKTRRWNRRYIIFKKKRNRRYMTNWPNATLPLASLTGAVRWTWNGWECEVGREAQWWSSSGGLGSWDGEGQGEAGEVTCWAWALWVANPPLPRLPCFRNSLRLAVGIIQYWISVFRDPVLHCPDHDTVPAGLQRRYPKVQGDCCRSSSV